MRRSQPLPPETSLPAHRPTQHATVERAEEIARVRAALHVLPEREREVFLLRQNGELSYAAIAEVIGAPIGTAKTRMRSALLRLRGVLERSGGIMEAGS